MTMFEVGKLNDESLDSFLTELGKVRVDESASLTLSTMHDICFNISASE